MRSSWLGKSHFNPTADEKRLPTIGSSVRVTRSPETLASRRPTDASCGDRSRADPDHGRRQGVDDAVSDCKTLAKDDGNS